MPALRAIYRRHPTTGVPGLWIDTIHAGLVGAPESGLPPAPTSGSQAARQAAYGATLTNLANTWLQSSVPVNQLAGSPVLTTPEPDCSIVGANYVCQIMHATVTVTSLSPLILAVELSEGASRSVQV